MSNAGLRMFIDPLAKRGVIGEDHREPAFEIRSLSAHQPFFIRIPYTAGLLIIEDERVVDCQGTLECEVRAVR